MTSAMNKTLFFSLDEYRGRLARLRDLMADRGLDVLLVHTPENIYYLTGYQTPGYYTYQCMVVPVEDEPVVFTRFMEEENVRALSWIESSNHYLDTQDPTGETCRLLRERDLAGQVIGVEKQAWFLTIADLRTLRAGLPEADFRDASGLVEQLRVVKSEQEIEYIRQAARVCEAGMRQAIEIAEAGRTENDLAVALYTGSIEAGGEYMSLPPFVASGARSALAHATWSGRRFEPGDAVFLEHCGTVHRYSASLIRMVSIGPPSDKLRRMDEAARRGLQAAIDTIGPGVPAAQVDRACRHAIEAAGFGEIFRHRTGYSIGVSFPPDWGEGHILSLKESEQRPLEPGMTFHLVPILMEHGFAGVGCSQTVLVTGAGCEVITDLGEPMLAV
ncbi:Xaa-Pro peptidase family protein [soil metagenome]